MPPPLHLRLFGWLDRRIQHYRTQLLLRRFARCGQGVSLQLPLVINHAEKLSLGDRVSINAFVHIWGEGGVTIGDDTLIASHVAITTLTHDARSPGVRYADTLISRPVTIGRNVWIGAQAVILPGVTIGDNAIVGAGAVVTRDVAPGTIVTGVPAVPRS